MASRPLDIGIAGAGLVGRLMAVRLLTLGHRVHLFECGRRGARCAGSVAAGMLSPCAELESGDVEIFELGVRSLDLWPSLIDTLGGGIGFARRGSLVTCHPRDSAIAERLMTRILRKLPETDHARCLDREEVAALEPGLAAEGSTWFLDNEGQVDAQAFMAASEKYLESRAEIRYEYAVASVKAGELRFVDGSKRRFDWVYDCRGLGADSPVLAVRGVRGELLWLKTAEVSLTRPVRVMHPRYRIYVVPRPDDLFVVGATEIESEDLSPVSVRSMMELASATAIVDPAFLEARVVRTDVQLRPATPDNQPHLASRDGVTEINGLFRHGYLVAPALVEDALDQSIGKRSAA